MSLPPLATLPELEARLGASVDNPEQALYLLDAASTIVRSVAGKLWVDEAGELVDVPDGASVVVVEMVARVADNPSGAVSTTEQLGPASNTISYGEGAADRLYLTTADRIIIGATANRAFTIDPTPATAEVPTLAGAVVNAAEDTELWKA